MSIEFSMQPNNVDVVPDLSNKKFKTSSTLQEVTDNGATTTNPIGVPRVDFDTTYVETGTEPAGSVYWNPTDETLDLKQDGATLQLGQEMNKKVRNATGGTLLEGTVVYENGQLGNRATIAKARSDQESTSRITGVLTQDIIDNDDGKVTTIGLVRQIKTNYEGAGDWGTTWNQGDLLYVSKTVAGQLTNIEPTVPHHSDIVGKVSIVGGAGIGAIDIQIQRHKTIAELADVDGSDPTTTGDLLTYESLNSTWERGIYNITDYAPLTTPYGIKESYITGTSTGTYYRLGRVPIASVKQNIKLFVRATTATGTTTNTFVDIAIAHNPTGNLAGTSTRPSIISNTAHSSNANLTSELGYVIYDMAVYHDTNYYYLDVRKYKTTQIDIKLRPLLDSDWEWYEGDITANASARGTNVRTTTLTQGFSGDNVVASSAGSSSSATYAQYLGNGGYTLSNDTDKTGRWSYFGYYTMTYSGSYLDGHSGNFVIWLSEQSRNSKNAEDLEFVRLDIGVNLVGFANSTIFNTTVPTLDIKIFGETTLTTDDIACLVYSTSTSTKIIRFYVKLKDPDTNYSVMAIDKYGRRYTVAGSQTTDTGFNYASNQAMIASLPTPAQGDIRYGTKMSYAKLSGADFTGAITATNLSGTNTGDQVADGITITGTGTALDPFVSAGGDTSGLVPYTGATTNVDLGIRTLTANNLTSDYDFTAGFTDTETISQPASLTATPVYSAGGFYPVASGNFSYRVYGYKEINSQKIFSPVSSVTYVDTFLNNTTLNINGEEISGMGYTYGGSSRLHKITVYPYKTIGGQNYYSASDYYEYYDYGYMPYYDMSWTWDTVAGADGYYVIHTSEELGHYDDYYVQMVGDTNTTLIDSGASTWTYGFPSLTINPRQEIDVTWNAIAGVDSYYVWVGQQGDTSFQYYFVTATNSFTDDGTIALNTGLESAIVLDSEAYISTHNLYGTVRLNELNFLDIPYIKSGTTRYITFEQDNILIGSGSGNSVSLLSPYNVMIGRDAGMSLTSGSSSNIILGYQALYTATASTSNNIAIGSQAFKNLDVTSGNIAIGTNAGLSQTSGSFNTWIGTNSGPNQGQNGAGIYNFGMGYNTMANLTSGSRNFALGFNSLYNVTTGSSNFGLGNNTLENVTTGSYNFGAGYQAGQSFTGGTLSTNSIGYYSNYIATVNDARGNYYPTQIANGRTAIGTYSISQFDGTLILGSARNSADFTKVGVGHFAPLYGLSVAGDTFIADNKYSDLGSDKIQNGTFPSSTGWTLTTGWTVTLGTLKHDSDGTGTASQTSANMTTPLVVGEIYELDINVASLTAGTLDISCAGVNLTTSNSIDRNSRYTFVFRALTTDALVFTPSNTSRFTIQRVELRQVTKGDLIVANDTYIQDAGNIILGSATGTKIGTATTEKLGFWNATPIIQPTTAGGASTFVANTSGIVNDTATFDGYTLGQVVKALRNAGLLA